MATTVATVCQRVRRFVGDWPDEDALTASLSSSATSVTVADATLYPRLTVVEVDQEAMLVTANASGTTVTVRRGRYGSAAAAHASGAPVLIKPRFLTADLVDAVNAAVQAAYPLIYKPVIDTSLTIAADTYEYTVPAMPSDAAVPIPWISKLELRNNGDTDYFQHRAWEIRRGATPKIKFRQVPDTGATVRITGYGPYPQLAYADSLDALWPRQAEDLIVEYAAAYLLAMGEARRVRVDTGVIDNREQANRTGASMNASNQVLRRFQIRLQQAALPPMAPHTVSVF